VKETEAVLLSPGATVCVSDEGDQLIAGRCSIVADEDDATCTRLLVAIAAEEDVEINDRIVWGDGRIAGTVFLGVAGAGEGHKKTIPKMMTSAAPSTSANPNLLGCPSACESGISMKLVANLLLTPI
jgi:hypothetical protein